MPIDAFISYSSRDKTAADASCAALEASGIRCWIAPRDVRPGHEYGSEILEAIHGSKVLVLVFSSNANRSPQIRREVERAVAKGVPVVPLRIEDAVPVESLEYFIGTIHWLDAMSPPLEQHLRRLVETVHSIVRSRNAEDGTAPVPPPFAAPPSAALSSPVIDTARRRGGPVLAAGIALAAIGCAAAVWAWQHVSAPSPQCQKLWVERNSYYSRYGLCFTSVRAKETFGTTGCHFDDPEEVWAQFPDETKMRINAIKDEEHKNHC